LITRRQGFSTPASPGVEKILRVLCVSVVNQEQSFSPAEPWVSGGGGFVDISTTSPSAKPYGIQETS